MYAEGVFLLGACPPYTLTLFPMVTLSARLKEMAESEVFGDQNFIMKLSACLGNHDAFNVVECFCYSLTIDESKLVSNAGKLIEVCDYLDLEALSFRVLTIRKDHVRSSFDHCLRSLAPFDVSHCLQTNRAFAICQTSFLDHLKVNVNRSTNILLVTVDRLFQIVDGLPPYMIDFMFDILACAKYSLPNIMYHQTWKIDSLGNKNLWFRNLSILAKPVDPTNILSERAGKFLEAKPVEPISISKEGPGKLVEAFQKACRSVLNLVMQERTEEKKNTSRSLTELREEFNVLCIERNCLKNELEKANEALATAQKELDVQGKDLEATLDKMQNENLVKTNSEKERATEEVKEIARCQLCMVARSDTLCLPCLHFFYCFNCLSQHEKTHKKCPACRASIGGLLKCVRSV